MQDSPMLYMSFFENLRNVSFKAGRTSSPQQDDQYPQFHSEIAQFVASLALETTSLSITKVYIKMQGGKMIFIYQMLQAASLLTSKKLRSTNFLIVSITHPLIKCSLEIGMEILWSQNIYFTQQDLIGSGAGEVLLQF